MKSRVLSGKNDTCILVHTDILVMRVEIINGRPSFAFDFKDQTMSDDDEVIALSINGKADDVIHNVIKFMANKKDVEVARYINELFKVVVVA
jgi:hypothetical protein